MADVRGKFTVTSIKKSHHSPDAGDVTLHAVYSNSPKDQTYAKNTPTAQIEMHVTNPSALDKLKLGQAFYVDFTAIEA